MAVAWHRGGRPRTTESNERGRRDRLTSVAQICEYAHMRTTVEIPDALGRRAKIRAAQEGRPLKAFIIQALERELVSAPGLAVPASVPVLPVLRSQRPGSLRLSPDEVSELLAREEVATYAADVRR